jgi:hypothetical protein
MTSIILNTLIAVMLDNIINNLSDEQLTTLPDRFEEVWVGENVTGHSSSRYSSLTDDEYILYVAWVELNGARMQDKHAPDTVYYRGQPDTEKLVFHGACHDCITQQVYDLETCKGCRYFRNNMSTRYPDNSTREVPDTTNEAVPEEKKTFFGKLFGRFKRNR